MIRTASDGLKHNAHHQPQTLSQPHGVPGGGGSADRSRVWGDVSPERLLTVEELARSLEVSTKTISRWRRRGLVSCRFVCDGRRRVGFRESSVRRFVKEHPHRVARGAQFSQLTPQERSTIVQGARELAEAGEFPAEVFKAVAGWTGRSIETVRSTLRKFDEVHPAQAVFPNYGERLRDETKREVYERFRQGENASELAERFCLAKARVRRVIGEMRLRHVMELPLDYISNEEFFDPSRQRKIMGPTPKLDRRPSKPRVPAGLPPYLASLYDIPLLSKPQEVHLFRKMNYLKHQANQLREGLNPAKPDARELGRIERLYEQAVAVRSAIVEANLRLVVSIARHHVTAQQDFFELVSDGNVSLIRAVEKFDFARGNKFSTYASVAIMKNFARTIPKEHRHLARFCASGVEFLANIEDSGSDKGEQVVAQAERENRVDGLLKHLNERERKILDRRFGLTRGHEPLTLKQVGAELGVTKERVRQLEGQAIRRIRKSVAETERQRAPVAGLA